MRRFLPLLLLLACITLGTGCSPASSDMTEYTDADFGFSFWYPSNWKLKDAGNGEYEKIFPGGRTVKTLQLTDARGDYVTVWEVASNKMKITDTGGAGPIGPVTYTHDDAKQQWMVDMPQNDPPISKEAVFRHHTMAGQPIFGGTSRFNMGIIPLAENKFVIVNDGGTGNATYLAKTVTPTGAKVDPMLKNSTLAYFSNASKQQK